MLSRAIESPHLLNACNGNPHHPDLEWEPAGQASTDSTRSDQAEIKHNGLGLKLWGATEAEADLADVLFRNVPTPGRVLNRRAESTLSSGVGSR